MPIDVEQWLCGKPSRAIVVVTQDDALAQEHTDSGPVVSADVAQVQQGESRPAYAEAPITPTASWSPPVTKIS